MLALQLLQGSRSDDELLARLGEDAEQDRALSVLQGRYGKRLFRLVLQILGDVHLAQDVTQDVFLKVLLKRSHYQLGTSFQAWLFAVARNQALSVKRQNERRPRPLSSIDATARDLQVLGLVDGQRRAEEQLGDREFESAFRTAVDRLPESHRRVFVMCVLEGLSYRDASTLLGIPIGTVGIRILRARKRLVSALALYIQHDGSGA